MSFPKGWALVLLAVAVSSGCLSGDGARSEAKYRRGDKVTIDNGGASRLHCANTWSAYRQAAEAQAAGDDMKFRRLILSRNFTAIPVPSDGFVKGADDEAVEVQLSNFRGVRVWCPRSTVSVVERAPRGQDGPPSAGQEHAAADERQALYYIFGGAGVWVLGIIAFRVWKDRRSAQGRAA